MVLEAVEERARGVDQVPGQDVYNEGKDRGQVRGILRDRREQPALRGEKRYEQPISSNDCQSLVDGVLVNRKAAKVSSG